MKLRLKKKISGLVLIVLLSITSDLLAVCRGSFMSVDEVCWGCMFPMTIGGTDVEGSGSNTEGNATLVEPWDAADGETVCECQYGEYERTGITYSLWEPAHMIETVKDPFCFPFIGESMADEFEDDNGAELRGVEDQAAGNQETQTTFAQVHYFEFPVWQESGGEEIEVCICKLLAYSH